MTVTPGSGSLPLVTRPDSLPVGFPCVKAGSAHNRATARLRINALTLINFSFLGHLSAGE